MNQQVQYEEELSLADILRVLKSYRRIILLAPVILSLVVLVFTWLFVPPKYQVQGAIEIGRVDGVLLDTPDVLVDRLNQPSFIARVVDEHPQLLNDAHGLTKNQLFKTFSAKKNKDSTLVSYTLKSRSRERGELEVSALMDTLAGVHGRIFEDIVEQINLKITLTEQQIDSLKNESETKTGGNSVSSNIVLQAMVLSERSNQLRTLTTRKLELEASLSTVNNFNTRLFERVYISEEPVSPNLPMVALVAYMLGLFCAILLAFVRESMNNKGL